MNFLITGAAGFLGSALANRLAAGGDVVVGVDDLSTGNEKALNPPVQFVRGDTGACARHHERSLAHAREAGDDECEAQALSGVADALYAQGRMASAHDAFAGCVELCDRRGNLRFSLMNRCMIGITGAYLCRLRESLVAIDEARVAARDIGHRVAEVMTGECAGLVLVDAGLFREAREPLEHSLALARRIASRRFAALDLALLGCIAWHDGDGEGARRLLDESWTMCEEIGTRFAGPIVLGMMARVAADDAGRRAAISRGEAMLDDGAMAHNHFWFRRDAIDASLAAGDFDAAERYYQLAVANAQAIPEQSIRDRRTQGLRNGRVVQLMQRGEAAAAVEAYYTEAPMFQSRPDPTRERYFGGIGTTGLKARIYPGVVLKVEEMAPGSPSEGKFAKGEILTGINGVALRGLNPFVVMGNALTKAEATDGRMVFDVTSADGKTQRKGREDADRREDEVPVRLPRRRPYRPRRRSRG